MTDKRIQRFFEFTEQNMMDSRGQARQIPFRYIAGIILLSILGIILIKMALMSDPISRQREMVREGRMRASSDSTHSVEKPSSIASRHLLPLVGEGSQLKSTIPPLHLTAVRQHLYTTPLHKADQVVFHHDAGDLNESWVVLDSVVFIPKTIG